MAASLNPMVLESPQVIPEQPVNILLVDDQPGRLMTYRAILEPLGERLVEATSGMEALKRLMDDEYAVILLDVNMPGMDGFETASLIHQHPRFEKTPIIFVTAVNVTDMDRLRGYKLGAVDYVMVPVIPEILRTKVVVLAELFRKRRELQQANIALQAEKSRELDKLNASLQQANQELETRNRELHDEVAERIRAEQRLLEADQRKDEFLATLAHELRNPLAPLLNALNLRRLAKPDLQDPLQELMERQLALLVRLIDDLLDIARITRGKLELRRGTTTLQQVLESAVETAMPLVQQGGHQLQVRMPQTPVHLHADSMRLSQVFANLLNNAAKYSDAGGRIDLRADADADGIRVSVRDAGIGLSDEQALKIFELFTQADTAIERARGGLGIGLTLVRRLTEMHGGQVSVRSEGLGMGSEFVVQLPSDVSARADSAADTPPPPAPAQWSRMPVRPDGRRYRALVVDDNHDAADTLAMMLELLGLDVQCLYDPLEFEASFDAFQPDVLFLDVGMPGRSGYDVARALRSQSIGHDVLLVAVTGWGQPEDRRRSSEAGFDHHLVKPPELAAILSICALLPGAAADSVA
ncbi:response regulator [Cognatiluteimonas profundi]|uniref:response regulator n=1 Tax=Cognatiluteimonas profundi TaxID=2594501 RepID=UPI00131B2D99|nr:response regulator [Lysobacter profundi]